MSVQHDYRGTGAPTGVVVAPVNSHYLDEDAEESWVCTWSDGTSSAWQRLKFDADVPVLEGGWTISDPTNAEGILPGAVVLDVAIAGPVYSNVELSPARTYTTAARSFVQIRKTQGGGIAVTVTPVTEYLP